MQKETYKCDYCGQDFQSGRYKLFCSKHCRALAGHAPSKFILFRRDRFRCIYCGRSSVEDGVQLGLDHVVPVTMGGEDEARNLVTCCQECNHAKNCTPLPQSVANRILEVLERRNANDGIRPSRVFSMSSGRIISWWAADYRDESIDDDNPTFPLGQQRAA